MSTHSRLLLVAVALVALLPTGDSAGAQTRHRQTGSSLSTARRSITPEGARVAADAVADAARRAGVGASIAVVDEGGHLVFFRRVEPTFAAGADISIGKARTAALFRRPTAFFEETIRGGRTPMIALDDFTPLQGGVPIEIDGEVAGAIGVSGASSAAQDEELAMFGVRAVRGDR
jgi:glc operon protein GlcG